MTDNLDRLGRLLDSADQAKLEVRVDALGEGLRLVHAARVEMNEQIKARREGAAAEPWRRSPA